MILNLDNSVHDQPNINGPNLKLKNFYGIAIMNWIRKNGTLKFTSDHMNAILVEACEALKCIYNSITKNNF